MAARPFLTARSGSTCSSRPTRCRRRCWSRACRRGCARPARRPRLRQPRRLRVPRHPRARRRLAGLPRLRRAQPALLRPPRRRARRRVRPRVRAAAARRVDGALAVQRAVPRRPDRRHEARRHAAARTDALLQLALGGERSASTVTRRRRRRAARRDERRALLQGAQWGFGATRGGAACATRSTHPVWDVYPVASYALDFDFGGRVRPRVGVPRQAQPRLDGAGGRVRRDASYRARLCRVTGARRLR